MHDIKAIRDEPETLITGLARRFYTKEGGVGQREAESIVTNLVRLDFAFRTAIASSQQLQEKRNICSKEIGQAMAAKDTSRAEALKAQVAALKEELVSYANQEHLAKQEFESAMPTIPNIPLADVPEGEDEHDNVEHGERRGVKREYAFEPKQHFEIGEALGLMDFEAAARISGSRFVVLKGGLARLERALGQFFLDVHTAPEASGIGGYTEVNPPLLVRDNAMFGTAQLPKFEEDQFAIFDGRTLRQIYSVMADAIEGTSSALLLVSDNTKRIADWLPKARRWLIPTAEVPLTNLVRESILSEEQLPLRYTALTPCFRAEAGAAGRDTRGMLRQHQFMKCELVSITAPEHSGAEHERMLACAEAVLTKLGLHYRVVTLCTGDMGFASQKTYDIEVWLPGQGAYREVSSCSTCGDFQARRMDARVKGKDGKTRFVHTLNGSGVAVGRALIAVLETYQNADGSVTVPDVLLPYMGGVTRIEKAV